MNMRSDDSVLLEQEFSDASLEWRRIFAEFWGTFLLVFAVACGHIASGLNTAETTRLSVAVVSGQWFSSRSIFQVRSAGRISIRRSARSLGPGLVRGDFSASLMYVAALLVGATIGVGFEWILKGPSKKSGDIAAQRRMMFVRAMN